MTMRYRSAAALEMAVKGRGGRRRRWTPGAPCRHSTSTGCCAACSRAATARSCSRAVGRCSPAPSTRARRGTSTCSPRHRERGGCGRGARPARRDRPGRLRDVRARGVAPDKGRGRVQGAARRSRFVPYAGGEAPASRSPSTSSWTRCRSTAPSAWLPADRLEVDGLATCDYPVYPVEAALADKLCGIVETFTEGRASSQGEGPRGHRRLCAVTSHGGRFGRLQRAPAPRICRHQA
jgi:hypothetical protein